MDLEHSLLDDSRNEINNSVSSLHDSSFNSYNSSLDPNLKPVEGHQPEPESSTDNSIVIPTYEQGFSRFSHSKISRSITFQSAFNAQLTNEELPKYKFGILKSETVTTFMLNGNVFSEFTNPKEVEKDQRVNTFFLLKDTTNDQFDYDAKEVMNSLSMEHDYESNIRDFLQGINDFFTDVTYQRVKKANLKYKLFMIISIIVLSLCILSSFVYMIISFATSFKAGIFILLLFVMGGLGYLLYYQLTSIKRMKTYLVYNKINYMFTNYTQFVKYIEGWNRSMFESCRIRVTIPVSMNYILFNMDPYQEIEIKHNKLNDSNPLSGSEMEGRDSNLNINRDTQNSNTSGFDINGVRESQMSAV